MNEYDDLYGIEGKYVLQLDDLFITEENTAWRDAYQILDSVSSVC